MAGLREKAAWTEYGTTVPFASPDVPHIGSKILRLGEVTASLGIELVVTG
jgi:hypothetical protein